MGEAAFRFPILIGSVRRDRLGIRPARMIERALSARGHHTELIDPMVLQLPLLDRMYKEYPKGEAPDVLEKLATSYRAADSFVIVAGEYNHGIQPALKNLLDHFLEEYYWRPSAIVCYSPGFAGGVRAAMQLRMTLSELGMPSIPSILSIPHVGNALDEDGTIKEPRIERSRDRFIEELEWFAAALKAQRGHGVPY